jgi:hypothetical protein
VWAHAKVLPFPPIRAPINRAHCPPRLARLCFRTQEMSRSARLPIPTASAHVSARHPWRTAARRLSHRGRSRVARACVAFGRTRREWLAIGVAVGNASARHARRAGRPFSSALRRAPGKRRLRSKDRRLDSSVQAQLEPAQRRTLEAGSCIVLSGVGIGFGVGSWPAWSFAAAIGLYCAWVVLYAEIAVQTSRRPEISTRPWWHGPQRSRLIAGAWQLSASKPQPPQEQRTA